MRSLRAFVLLTLLALPLAAFAQREKFSPDDVDYVAKTWPQAKKTDTSIRYIIERPGDGAPPKAGDMVTVFYTGKLFNGTVFDQNHDAAHPFSFRVGREQVIRAWDQTLPLMQPGEKRLIIVPPELGYGTHGWLPKIPRDSSLIFEIELLKVQREE